AEPLTHERKVPSPEERHRKRLHRGHVRGQLGRVISRTRSIWAGHEDHQPCRVRWHVIVCDLSKDVRCLTDGAQAPVRQRQCVVSHPPPFTNTRMNIMLPPTSTSTSRISALKNMALNIGRMPVDIACAA